MNGRKHEAGRWMRAGIALLGVLALLVGVLATTATAKSDAGNTATAAKKKKCKKKKHSNKASEAKKKKKCKKKKNPAVAPAPAPQVPSTVRATLSWTDTSDDVLPMSDGDFDLYVWDTTGVGGHLNRDFVSGPTVIPNTVANPESTNGFDPETFTDLLSPSTRRFTYGVCVASPPPVRPATGNFTLTVRFGDGTTVVRTQTDFGVVDFKDKGDFGLVSDPGGSFAPPGTWCPT